MRNDSSAWCFAASRDTLERFEAEPGEFFDPSFRVWYQDTDLLARLRAAGSPPVCVEGSRIRHGLSETVASDDPELRAWVAAEVARDREAFLAKHPEIGLPAVSMGWAGASGSSSGQAETGCCFGRAAGADLACRRARRSSATRA